MPAGAVLTASEVPLGKAPGPVDLDYMMADRKGGKVWVPAGGTGSVVVIDGTSLQTKRVEGFATSVRSLGGHTFTLGPTAVALGDGVAYIGSRGDNRICVVDATRLELGACVSLGAPDDLAAAADGMAYVPGPRELWITRGAPTLGVMPPDSSILVFDASDKGTLKPKTKVEVPGAAEGYAVDEAHGVFYTNVVDKDLTLAVDIASHRVRSVWHPQCGKEGPRGLGVDSARGTVFVACTDHVVALDAAHDGAILASAPVGEGIDNIDYVESRHELFVAASRPAKLAVFRFDAGAFQLLATGTTARGARVVVADDSGTAFVGDPAGGRVLVFRAASHAGGAQAEPLSSPCRAATAVVPGSAPAGGSLPLTPALDIPLPGNATRFDYQAIDPAGRRLYMAHLGDSSLLVFDLDRQCVVQEIPSLPSVHGVVAAPEEHLLFATATAEKSLAIIDDRTFQVKARVPAGEYPNGLAYDPASGRVFISNNRGTGVGVIDVRSARALTGIDVGGGAGNTQFDAGSGHVLAAVHGQAFLADIDPATSQVAARITLPGVSSCHGLLVASGLRLAFAACRGREPRLAVVDLRSRRETATLPLPPDVDVLAFDDGLRRLYAASETGPVAAFDVAPDGSVTELGRGTVGPDAHSVAVDPATHRVYFPLENVGGRPILRVMAPASLSSGGGSRRNAT